MLSLQHSEAVMLCISASVVRRLAEMQVQHGGNRSRYANSVRPCSRQLEWHRIKPSHLAEGVSDLVAQ